MNNDPASLSNLQDIVLPDPVPFWPPGSGGLLLLAGLLLSLALIILQYYLHKRRNRYRRAGLALLADAATTRDVSVALKRVALAAFPRQQVASLYGQGWVDFLNATCPRPAFEPGFFADPEAEPAVEMRQAARMWIGSHRRPPASPKGGG